MSSNNPVVTVEPFAVRAREGARLAGKGLTKFYQDLNQGIYESYYDGPFRMVVDESIKGHQRQQFEVGRGTQRTKPASRKGGPGRQKKSDKSEPQDAARRGRRSQEKGSFGNLGKPDIARQFGKGKAMSAIIIEFPLNRRSR